MVKQEESLVSFFILKGVHIRWASLIFVVINLYLSAVLAFETFEWRTLQLQQELTLNFVIFLILE